MEEEWSAAKPEHLPDPTYAPAGLALAIVFICLGVVTTLIVSLVGLGLFIISLAAWINALRHEHEREASQ